ncbi:MAG: septal ring lytic transglycosylase RlpA family protein [Candidatus Omnitrophica bacterium]|nr:septal ring lytic transglycosylase RlpA family protein [Candidatus Omnitrophota bacterium]
MRPVFLILLCAVLFYLCANTAGVWRGVIPLPGNYPAYGLASWYQAEKTASGESFDESSFTCAMRRRDYGKYYRVCSLDNGKCVVVRHNDFGPAKRYYNEARIIDLSKAAFSRLEDLETGVIRVTVAEVERNI